MIRRGRGFATASLAFAGVLAWVSTLAWTYPPQGPYGGPPPGGYQRQPQYPYQGMPQTPYPGQAQGAYPYAPQPTPYQYRPRQPDNAQGVPPAYQPAPNQMPGYQGTWPGGYSQPAAPRKATPPSLEWSLDETSPYVQQNLLLRLRLISEESLTTADPLLPANGDALVQKLAGPDSTTRSKGDGRREVVTEFVLTLTPLRHGNLELPPLKITGTRPGAYGTSERYEAAATNPVRLQVRPAMASVRPWLPLKSLTLNATIDHSDQIQPGQPVSLALTLSAVGAEAAQLPNLEDQLKSPDFRVYREQTLTDSGLTKDGRQLVGTRTEYYTLVPQSGGKLSLPEIAVPWWNVATNTREVAKLPIRTINIAGAEGPFGLPASMTGAGSGWGKVWLPLVALLLVLAGYWGGVFYHHRTPGEGLGLVPRVRDGVNVAARTARTRGRAVLAGLHPGPIAARLGAAALGALPQSSRLLMVVRHANQAKDPAGWCDRFEQAARRHLRLRGKGTIPGMTARMLELRPRADRAKLTRLMEQLDAALYGRQDIDFPRWKRDFMRQMGRSRGLFRRRRAETRIRRAHLPALNPRVADAGT